jgi:hypothetical protein
MTRQAVNYLVAEIGKRAKLRFHTHPHMLRHSTGYYLANRGYDTRPVQDYLGPKSIAHTVRYTRRDCGVEKSVVFCPPAKQTPACKEHSLDHAGLLFINVEGPGRLLV